MVYAMRRRLGVVAAALVALLIGSAVLSTSVFADPGASDLPPNWHVHDGQTSLGAQHKGIGFFPTILGVSSADYALDPAECPNATDKAFLPSNGSSQSDLLRAGTCQTDSFIIHLRTVRTGVDGPEGWSSLTTASEPGWVTYYALSAR